MDFVKQEDEMKYLIVLGPRWVQKHIEIKSWHQSLENYLLEISPPIIFLANVLGLNMPAVNAGRWVDLNIPSVSWHTPAGQQNYMIRTRSNKEVCFCLAFMSFTWDVCNPKWILIMDMIQQRKVTLKRCRTYSFKDDMMVFLRKSNINVARMIKLWF